MFAVVHFLAEDTVECVPVTWIDGGECFWPQKNAKKKIEKLSEPDKEIWKKFEIRRVGRVYNTLEEARKICQRAEDTSNVESDDPGRKRKVPERYRKESESSDEADDEGDQGKQRSTIQTGKRPTPPPGFALGSRHISLSTLTTGSKESAPCTPSKQVHRNPVQRKSPRSSARATEDSPNKRRRTDQATTVSLNTHEQQKDLASDSVLLRQILDKLDDIQKDVKHIKEQYKVDVADITEDEIQAMLPSGEKLNSPEQLEEFEDNLDEGKRKKIVAWLASLEKGENGGAICRAIMRALMTNKLMSAYSGFGQKGKKRFIGTVTYKVMLSAARKACRKSLSNEDLKEDMLEVLRHAPYKPGGSNYKKKKGQKRTEETAVQDVTDSD